MHRARQAAWIAFILLALGGPGIARAQCMLANPSFEIPGQAGSTFGGWYQFGPVGSTPNATHGATAARVLGPDTGGWAVSGFWQPLETVPGDRWSVRVCVWHPGTRPLTGQSTALVNIEWRDAGDNLISYESHAPIDASTPIDEIVTLDVESGPAPPGAVTTRLLLAVLQGPGDPQPEVRFDQAEMTRVGPPSQDDVQWNDFVGGTTLDFAGYTWRVKGPGYYGPGPSLFSNDPSHIWVDGSDRLHMTIKNSGGLWYSTETMLEDTLGYGDYVFTIDGALDQWDPFAVLGLFTWEYGACYEPEVFWWNPFNEIDVEISRWGNPFDDVAQFVAQPYDWPGNLVRYDPTPGNPTRTSHAFRWLPDRVEFRAWRGGPDDESAANLIHAWTYGGYHVPRPEQPRVHINFWQFESTPPFTDQEAVISDFTFVPACIGPHCVTDVAEVQPAVHGIELAAAVPNPLGSRTTLRYVLAHDTHAALEVFDVSGRLVRSLANRFHAAGRYEVPWDGRDESGAAVAPGVYLYRLRSGSAVVAKRLVVLD